MDSSIPIPSDDMDESMMDVGYVKPAMDSRKLAALHAKAAIHPDDVHVIIPDVMEPPVVPMGPVPTHGPSVPETPEPVHTSSEPEPPVIVTEPPEDDVIPFGTEILPPAPENKLEIPSCADVQFTTDPNQWKIKPSDFPVDIWPTVRRMRFTDGSQLYAPNDETQMLVSIWLDSQGQFVFKPVGSGDVREAALSRSLRDDQDFLDNTQETGFGA